MPDIRMRPTDLGELYTLLSMYQDTYGRVPEGFMEQVKKHYQEAAARRSCNKEEANVPLITNPRGAGRKNHADPEETSRMIQMRHSGATIRRIAAEFGCSTGRVHKLINEHE